MYRIGKTKTKFGEQSWLTYAAGPRNIISLPFFDDRIIEKSLIPSCRAKKLNLKNLNQNINMLLVVVLVKQNIR